MRSQPGFVIVAEFGTPEGPGVRFSCVPPPKEVLSNPLGTLGEELPERLNEFGKIFEDRFKVFVFYQGANRTIRYLEIDQPWEKAHYDDNMTSPHHSFREPSGLDAATQEGHRDRRLQMGMGDVAISLMAYPGVLNQYQGGMCISGS